MSTEIKRLKLQGKEFVPITLAEAVVVNTNNIPGFTNLTITTLDKVLLALGISIGSFNSALEDKLDSLTAGAGIIIKNGVISTTAVTTLYKIVTTAQFRDLTPSADCMNVIYLVPSGSALNNCFVEFVCIPKEVVLDGETTTKYFWEQLGEILSEVDLSGYVTTTVFNTFKALAITAVNVTTSDNQLVIVTYNIPADLYDSMVGKESSESVKDKIETPEITAT